MTQRENLDARSLPVSVLLKMTSDDFRRGYRKGSRLGIAIAKSIFLGEVEATAEQLAAITGSLISGKTRGVKFDELLGVATGLSTELAAKVAGGRYPRSGG
jgi:hypothetical protein